jgi:hypothetical protein
MKQAALAHVMQNEPITNPAATFHMQRAAVSRSTIVWRCIDLGSRFTPVYAVVTKLELTNTTDGAPHLYPIAGFFLSSKDVACFHLLIAKLMRRIAYALRWYMSRRIIFFVLIYCFIDNDRYFLMTIINKAMLSQRQYGD